MCPLLFSELHLHKLKIFLHYAPSYLEILCEFGIDLGHFQN